MKIEDEILINMYAQDLIEIDKLKDNFELLNLQNKTEYLNNIIELVI